MDDEVESKDTIHKIAILGTPRSGKTTLGVRLAKNEYKDDIRSTRGIDFHVVKAELGGITLQIWDYAGQSHYKDAGIFTDMVKGSSAYLFCYDASDPSSMKQIDNWITVAKTNKKFYQTKKYLVGLKADLIDKASAIGLTSLVKRYVNNPNLITNHFILSAKDDMNIDLLIAELEEDLKSLRV